MDIFAPSYYKKFKCIAGKCQHNCCIGWEIDIDSESLDFYKTQSDIIDKISFEGSPHFLLGEQERCPFLNNDNLCDLILEHGERNLCQICRDHPRFRNFFDTRTEIGLGLTCEAAARLILDNDFSLEKIGDDGESSKYSAEEGDFFSYRDEIFGHRPEQFAYLLPKMTVSELAEVFITLERLDPKWNDVLATLKNRNESLRNIQFDRPQHAKRLFDYFVFRHLHETGLEFCVLCTYFVMFLDGDIYEMARMFSSEIEYSDQNIEMLMNKVFN